MRDQRDDLATYVLPVAPFPCDIINDVLSKIKRVAMSEFADAELKI